VAWGAAAGAAGAQSPEASLRASLTRSLRLGGGASGVQVLDLDSRRVLFARRASIARVPASNEKLFTSAAALLRFGADGRLSTGVFGDGRIGADGTYVGNLYLKGGGDPTFGSTSFTRRAYGSGATVTQLAQAVATLGIVRVRGRVLGDESFFDQLRGTPAEGFALSTEVTGQLSALAYNRGLARESGGSFQRRPATFAAARLRAELVRRGVSVTGSAGERTTPASAEELAVTQSPPLATILRLTNAPSDNFFAEMLLKGLGARFGAGGTTASGAAVARTRLRRLGVRPRMVDGSGLSRADRTTPATIVRLLDRMHSNALAAPFEASLAVAGRTGTLAPRMRGTAAQGRCRGKTGTLSDVSALSGLCVTRGGHTLAFSILFNRVNVVRARRAQDRMAAAIAAYRGGSAARVTRPHRAAPAAPARR
jgi:D-alanyl-D-alanine carboxypeptidase/D-alanyl-D-alanine-endopeptidase (penicillin-binding protein 4)